MKLQVAARTLALSPLFNRAQNLWERNRQNVNMPLSKFDKLLVGTYLILRDFSQGQFPPSFDDQQKAYEAEIGFRYSLPGVDAAAVTNAMLRKPFWYGRQFKAYMTGFMNLVGTFEQVGVEPPQKLLELGCGMGWMSEFLALMSFDVVGTSISSLDIQDAQTRVESLKAKHLGTQLEFRTTPMESVAEAVQDRTPFDCIFVFEALHHAYDWRQAVESSYSSLRPGGWLIIANEPNVLHTFISYRIAKLTNAHELGFTQNELIQNLKQTGFRKITILKNAFGFYLRPHWIAAKK